MADIVNRSQTYRLRAGSPMPVDTGVFVIHTFMAERGDVDNYFYTNDLPSSNDFRARGGDYISANFTRLLDKDKESFQGKITHNPEYIEEAFIE